MAARFKPYNYKKVETTGEIREKEIRKAGGYYSKFLHGKLVTSPYTPLIPLVNVVCTPSWYENFTPNFYNWAYLLGVNFEKLCKTSKYKQFTSKFSKSFIGTLFCRFWESNQKEEWKKWVVDGFIKTLFDDTEKTIFKSNWGYGRKAYLLDTFTEGDGHNFSMRSYSGYVDYLTFKTGGSIQVLPVVLPENYLSARFQFLLTGKIDLSKVIVLINKDLDMPSYSKPIRDFYKKELEPQILRTACTVWKVPADFISENCYYQTAFEFESKGAKGKLQETEALIDGFKKWLGNTTPDARSGLACDSLNVISTSRNEGTVATTEYDLSEAFYGYEDSIDTEDDWDEEEYEEVIVED